MDERYVNREIETDAESVGDTIRTVKRTKHVNYFDYSLLFVVIFLICFGCLMLYSASSFSSVIKFEDSTFYLKKHLLSVFLGTGALVFCTFFDYRLYKEKSIFITVAYWLSIFSLFLVKFSPLGMEYNGAKRWLNIGEFSIQPAEIVKITTILSIALVISNFSRELQSRKTMGIILVYTIVSAGGVTVLTQNLSSGIIIGFIGVSMLFISNRKYIIFGVISAVSVVLILIVMKFGASFRMGRIDAWLDPMGNSQEGGFQILQGLYAIGSGGMFGKGLGQSVQKMGYIPEAQNDYIFTIICEELGLVGAAAIICLFIFLIYRMFSISNNAPDLFGSMIVTGVLMQIAIQTVLNIAVVTNSIPNTGVTLPFISYGGTSILFLMAEVGLVLSVSKRIKRVR